MGNNVTDKALLNVKEVCEYLGIGESKARELLTKTYNNFTVRIGNLIYANKIQLDKWIATNSGNRVEKKRYPKIRKRESQEYYGPSMRGGYRMM